MENKALTYPFPFAELRITSSVLDKLGFTEYWSGCGEFGERIFGIREDPSNENGIYINWYRIVEYDELDYGADAGYGGEPYMYQSQYWSSPFNAKVHRNIYFLHDLYEDISDNAPEVLEIFLEKSKEKGVNMYPYIQSYLKWKNGE